MDRLHELNINTQDGGNAVVNVNPEHVVIERSVLGRDTPPCPFAVALRRERLREHWETRRLAAEQKRHRRERILTIIGTVFGFLALSIGLSVVTGPAVPKPWLWFWWSFSLGVLSAVTLRESARSAKVHPTPPKPPELE